MTRVLAASAALLLTAACAPATVPALTAPSHRPHADFDLGTTTTTPPPTTTTTRAVRASRGRSAGVDRRREHTPASSPRSNTLNWAALRRCESGDRYDNKRNPAFRGAYQAGWSTWAAYWKRHHRPDLARMDPADASPADQDSFAFGLYSERGGAPWPVCRKRL